MLQTNNPKVIFSQHGFIRIQTDVKKKTEAKYSIFIFENRWVVMSRIEKFRVLGGWRVTRRNEHIFCMFVR